MDGAQPMFADETVVDGYSKMRDETLERGWTENRKEPPSRYFIRCVSVRLGLCEKFSIVIVRYAHSVWTSGLLLCVLSHS